jgi:hypothetical protein
MAKDSKLKPYLKRLLVVATLSIVFVTAFNEITFMLQKDEYDRAPQTITLVIPAGTAERVEAGEDVPSIPDEMVFVLGDLLEIKNEDTVNHQLGPIWVPPGSTGSLVMEQAENYAFSCSFQTSRYLGLDVRQPTTIGTRMIALGLAAPTVTTLVFIYSLLVIPVKPRQTSEEESIPPTAVA